MYTFTNRDDGVMAYTSEGEVAVAHVTMTEVERYTEKESFKDGDKTKERHVVKEKRNILSFDRFRIHFTSQVFRPNDVQVLLNELADPAVLESFARSREYKV